MVSFFIFAEGRKEVDINIEIDTSFTSGWDSGFLSHPSATVRDCFPQNSKKFYMAFASRQQFRENETAVVLQELSRQLQFEKGVHVSAEFLDYREGSNFFSKWYNVKVVPLFPMVDVAPLLNSECVVETVTDYLGTAMKFRFDGNISLSHSILAEIQGAQKPLDWFSIGNRESSYLMAVGISLQSAVREDGWRASDQAALLELAKMKDLKIESKTMFSSSSNSEKNIIIDGSLIKIDVEINGFHVLVRWHDEYYYYSLAICQP